MTIEQRVVCLRINCPELYADDAFAAWLEAGAKAEEAGKYGHFNPVATWHRGEGMGESSDVFVTYDHGEGSDSDMPEHCWQKLCETMKVAGVEYAMLWLTNLEE